jgi:hypothetical protein
MKNFLSNALCWSWVLNVILDPLKSDPIRLVPSHQDTPSVTSPLTVSSFESSSFWEGTPPPLFETYFPKIPLHLTSPVLRHLRSLLLKEAYSPLNENENFEKSRFSFLLRTGQLDEAQNFLLDTNLPDKEALLLDLQWIKGDHKKTCEKIANLIRTSPDPEWKKQNVYCLYESGEKERAKIALELLSESKPEDLAVLNALFDSVDPPPFDTIIARSPFLLTVWCATVQDIPENALNTLSPASLALVAKTDTVPIKTRLLAGEKAFLEDTLKSEEFLSLLSEAPSNNIFMKAEAAFTSLKPEEMLALCQMAFQHQQLGLFASLFKDLLGKIELTPENLPLAPYLIRAFLKADEKELAQKWGAYLMREAPEEAISILPLLHLQFSDIKWEETQLQAYQAYQLRENPAQATDQSYCLRHILEALGETQGPAMTGEPEPPSWRQESLLFGGDSLTLLEAAVKSGRKGEFLLLTLTLIGEAPLKELSCDKMARLLRALAAVGYSTEARALALDFLLAKGF